MEVELDRARKRVRTVWAVALASFASVIVTIALIGDSDVVSILGLLTLVVVFPISILTSRDARRAMRDGKQDLHANVVERYEAYVADLPSRADGSEGGIELEGEQGGEVLQSELLVADPDPPSDSVAPVIGFNRLSSGRLIDADAHVLQRVEGIDKSIAVATVDEESSMVRALKSEERQELERFLRDKRIPWLAMVLTLWWSMGALSLLGGTLKGWDRISWAVLTLVMLANWFFYMQRALFRSRVRRLFNTDRVVRFEKEEYLGDSHKGLMWSSNGIPAPWRRFSP